MNLKTIFVITFNGEKNNIIDEIFQPEVYRVKYLKHTHIFSEEDFDTQSETIILYLICKEKNPEIEIPKCYFCKQLKLFPNIPFVGVKQIDRNLFCADECFDRVIDFFIEPENFKKDVENIFFQYFVENKATKLFSDNLLKTILVSEEKIVELFKLYTTEIPLEMEVLKIAFNTNQFKRLRNSAHKLHPQLIYLGNSYIVENVKTIEILAEIDNCKYKLKLLITESLELMTKIVEQIRYEYNI